MFVCCLPVCSRKGLASDLICMAAMLARCVDDVTDLVRMAVLMAMVS